MGLLMHHFLIIEKASPRAVIFRRSLRRVIAVNNKEQTVCSGWYIVPLHFRVMRKLMVVFSFAPARQNALFRPELLHIPAIGYKVYPISPGLLQMAGIVLMIFEIPIVCDISAAGLGTLGVVTCCAGSICAWPETTTINSMRR